ncbi:MAG: bifunctional N-acetylglucosamine-1-phosphate uridyltransferase/glucosamine-1-phosphate acetyltransferase, partial [Thermodesulfobacteria bacterium]|nr:bifunctional N-acetylglucosamine-1-phosphate uridyltransferase/glucosamine-1-phosphate acetyltransferase [Thermodesulfobacteriota bacterium]
PLFKPQTINEFIQRHEANRNKLSLLSAKFHDPTGYGRIVRGPDGTFRKVVEEKDATSQEKAIKEVNTGTYLVDRSLLFQLVKLLDADNAQGEYYLTDIVELAVGRGERVEAYCLATEEEALGVNSRRQLAQAENVLLWRIRHRLMDAGVTLSLPDTIYIESDVEIGRDVFIGPHTIIKSGTRIGEGATVLGHSYISGAVIDAGHTVEPFTVLKG